MVLWLYYGVDYVWFIEIKRLLKLVLSVLVILVVFVINFQGVVFVVGVVFLLVSVVIYILVRIVSCLVIQFMGVVNWVIMLEIGCVVGVSVVVVMLKFLLMNLYLVFFVFVLGGMVFVFFGQDLVIIWS